MPATAIEKEAEAKTSRKASVDGSRRDPGTASPVLDGAHAPVMDGDQPAFLDSRTLLSLQATAGNAAVTSVVEAAKRSGSNGQSASSRPAPGAARQLGTAHTFEAKPPPSASASASAVAETLVPGGHELTGESAPEAAGGGALAGATVAAEPQATPAEAAAPGESDGELAALDTAVAAPDSAAATGPQIAEGAAAAGGRAESAAGAADAPEVEQEEPAGGGEAAGPAETGAGSEDAAGAPEDASAAPEDATAAQDQAPAAAGEAGAGDSTGLVSQDAQAELSAEQSGFPSEEFRGAGGGGGGSAIGERPPPPVPDLGHADPTHGLATIASLPPAQLLAALGGVAASASRLAAQEHANLASHPPQRARHPGAPATVSAPAASRHPAPAQAAPRAIPRPPEGRDARLHEPEPLPTMPAPATAAVPQPQISAGADGQLTSTDTQQLTAALAGLPARDPALGLSVGAAPQLPLEGNADPKQVHEQRGHLNQGRQHESAEGRQQASAPMGEEEIFPTVPADALNTEVVTAGTAGVATAAAPPPPGGPDGGDENASILAGQLRGVEIRSAVSQGVATVTTRRQEYAQRTVQERARSDQEMASLEAANTAEQGSERAAAKQQVHGLREQWTGEQQALG